MARIRVASVVRTIVAKQQIWLRFAGDIEIRAAVIVKVAPGNALYEAQLGKTELRGDVGERPVLIVVKKLTRMALPAGRFVADKQIEPSVVVEIGPRGSLRGMKRKQVCFFGDIVEGAVAVVSQ